MAHSSQGAAIQDLLPEAPAVCRGDRAPADIVIGTAGPEEPPVYFIKTACGVELGVTEFHPMIVVRLGRMQIVAARDVLVNDQMPALPKDGGTPSLTGVDAIECRHYPGIVYNIEIDGTRAPQTHLIVANGVVTGDLYLQHIIERAQQGSHDERDEALILKINSRAA